MTAEKMAQAYARDARSDTGRPYPISYRKQLIQWWMKGWREEPGLRGTTLENAHDAGRKAREASRL